MWIESLPLAGLDVKLERDETSRAPRGARRIS
jgi:hypothetical protein